jgi:multiple sugar transport system permease protein
MLTQSFYINISGESRFVGLAHYENMFSRAEFWNNFRKSLVYSFGSLIISVAAGLSLALALDKVVKKSFRNLYSTLLLSAWAVPRAVTALILAWVFSAVDYSLVNMILLDVGVIEQSLLFFSNKHLALGLVTVIDGWVRTPFAMIIFLAGLQSIPQHMYEAARVDGATIFQTFRNVTLPYLKPYFAVVMLINWMFAFREFAVIYPITQGGPGIRTTTLSIYIFRRGIVNLQFGYAAAVSTFLVVITLFIAIFYVRNLTERIEE